MIGAALGGFVTNITATAEATDGTLFAGLVPNALSGLANGIEFKEILYQKVSKAATDNLRQGTEHCIGGAILSAEDQYFTGDDRAFLEVMDYLKKRWLTRLFWKTI